MDRINLYFQNTNRKNDICSYRRWFMNLWVPPKRQYNRNSKPFFFPRDHPLSPDVWFSSCHTLPYHPSFFFAPLWQNGQKLPLTGCQQLGNVKCNISQWKYVRNFPNLNSFGFRCDVSECNPRFLTDVNHASFSSTRLLFFVIKITYR